MSRGSADKPASRRRIAIAVATLVTALPGMAEWTLAAESQRAIEPYVPPIATSEQLETATPLHPYLSGVSAEYPDACEGSASPRRRQLDGGVPGRVDLLSPLIEVEGLTPGRTYSYCFTVYNVGVKPENFSISAVDLIGSSDVNQQREIVWQPTSAGRWLRPALTRFSLEAGEMITIPYVAQLPPDPPRGLNVGALRVQRDIGQPRTTGAGIRTAILHQLLITMPGGVSKPLSVSNRQAPRVLFRTRGARTYRARFDVHNEGTVAEAYSVRLRMRGLGRDVGRDERPTSVLLPDSAQRVTLRIGEMPWIGMFRPRATIEVREGDPVSVALPRVIVLPPWPYVAALLGSMLFAIIVLVRRRRREERHRQLDGFSDDDERWDDPD